MICMVLFSGVAVAMDNDTPKEAGALQGKELGVDLTALNNGGELRSSPVRSFSMPSPSPASPRSGNTSPRINRFLSQHTLAGQMEKTAEGSHYAVQKLRECEAKLMILQGGASDRQAQIRVLTDEVKNLTDRLLQVERSHADDQRAMSEAVFALKDAMRFLQLTTQVKKVNSQPLRVSATRVAFAQSTAAPAVTSSGAMVGVHEKSENIDDETLCSSDDDHTTAEETE